MTKFHTPDLHSEGTEEDKFSRSEWIAKEKAEQATKSVEVLAAKNAALQWDLNEARAKLPKDGQVVATQADLDELAKYRDLGPLKDLETMKGENGTLKVGVAKSAYDAKRAELLSKYVSAGGEGLTAEQMAAIPTAEELAARPGGEALLENLDLLRDVERFTKAIGATVAESKRKKDMGDSPADTTKPEESGSKGDGATSAKSYWDQRIPKTQ